MPHFCRGGWGGWKSAAAAARDLVLVEADAECRSVVDSHLLHTACMEPGQGPKEKARWKEIRMGSSVYALPQDWIRIRRQLSRTSEEFEGFEDS